LLPGAKERKVSKKEKPQRFKGHGKLLGRQEKIAILVPWIPYKDFPRIAKLLTARIFLG
jgi:hypothetical protein